MQTNWGFSVETENAVQPTGACVCLHTCKHKFAFLFARDRDEAELISERKGVSSYFRMLHQVGGVCKGQKGCLDQQVSPGVPGNDCFGDVLRTEAVLPGFMNLSICASVSKACLPLLWLLNFTKPLRNEPVCTHLMVQGVDIQLSSFCTVGFRFSYDSSDSVYLCSSFLEHSSECRIFCGMVIPFSFTCEVGMPLCMLGTALQRENQ